MPCVTLTSAMTYTLFVALLRRPQKSLSFRLFFRMQRFTFHKTQMNSGDFVANNRSIQLKAFEKSRNTVAQYRLGFRSEVIWYSNFV